MGMVLKIGDKAVYPGHGVGKVTAIEKKAVLGLSLTCYSIEILKTKTTIMIPESQLNSIGIRPVISKKEAEKVLDILKDEDSGIHKSEEKNWQKRHQAYMDKIKTGSIYEIAKVVRDLSKIQEEKELSYGEKRMMGKAQTMVYAELAQTIDPNELKKISQFATLP